MTSPSQPSGFAAYFAAHPTSAASSSSSSSAPLIHGLTSPPRTDSPSDSKLESGKASVSESPAPQAGYVAATTPIPTPPTHATVPKPRTDVSEWTKRAWKLVHDPDLHPKGSVGRNKAREMRESGQGVTTVSDPRKHDLNYGPASSKGRKKYTTTLHRLQFQFDANSLGQPPPAQIVIWGFSPVVTPEQVQTHFRPFGEIQELDYKVDTSTGASLGVCRIKYKVDKKDMMSGHTAAKKAAQEGVRIKLGGTIVQVELDKDGLKTLRRMGEAVKKRHAEQAAQQAAREQAVAAKEAPLLAPKSIPTGPAADRRRESLSTLMPTTPPPPTSTPRLNSPARDSRRSIDSRTPLNDIPRSRRTSPSPIRDRTKSFSDTRFRQRSPEPRSRPRDRSRSIERSHYRARSRSRSRSRDSHSRSRSRPRDWSRDREDRRYRQRSRSRSRSLDRRRDRDDSRRYSPRRRSPSPDRRRDDAPRHRTDDRSPSVTVDEYRPPYSTRFRPGVDSPVPRDRRPLTPTASPARTRTSTDRDDDRGRSRKRTPPPRTRGSSSDSSSPDGRRRSTNHDRERRRHKSSESRSPSLSRIRIPVLSPAMSNKLRGRPYVFINDRDLPVDRFSARDLGLCFKKFHPAVYDDHHGFYIAFYNYQDARDCYATHGDGKSFIDGYRLRMQIVDDKESIRATRSIGSPPRRKPAPVKKTIEDEAVDSILAELKEVFMKDVRSRIVNPMILDCLDPAHYKDIHPKPEATQSPIVKTTVPEVKVSSVTPVKQETTPINRLSLTNRIPLLPRFKKKGEPVKEDSVRDHKPTKADVRPMHHQFNYYSDSEDEDETRQLDGPAISDDEDDSSRPSRETTSVSTPEPSRVKKPLARTKDVISVRPEEPESDDELLKDILDKTKEDVVPSLSKRKRVVDFTSSEDEDEPSPPKKICIEPEVTETTDAMEIDEPATPKMSKATILKTAKAKAAALRRAKRAEAKTQEIHDSIEIESAPVEEIKPASPVKLKIPEVDLAEIEDDEEILLDLDGIQSLVRDKEDYRYLTQVLENEAMEAIQDIWTWSWMTKKLKALNFDGPMTKPEPPAYNRINLTGSARTEGYIKIPQTEKSLYLPQRNRAIIPIGSEAARKTSRMNRVNNRRLAADMEVQKKTLSTESDILRFNQLKARKKQLKFARSPIHDWGLFAMEDIEAHEMVIEYVGEIIRFQVAELREKQYERVGIGSSYLFRIDDENIIDATKTGNIARFINHCCTPNCSAKIIQVQGEKKIVIYADRFIGAGEEITYDYKFPREDVKIPCFCGSAHCKGTLN